MNNLSVLDLKAFVPALDFETSKQFYSALGCDLQYEAEKLAVFELGNCRFYLQDFYVKEFAEQYMLHITVSLPDFASLCPFSPRFAPLFNTYVTPNSST